MSQLSSDEIFAESLTAIFPEEESSPVADVPVELGRIGVYNALFTRPILFQQIHVHMIGVKTKDTGSKYRDDSGGIKGFSSWGFDTAPSPTVVVRSDPQFPIGNHTFPVIEDCSWPIWDSKCRFYSMKGAHDGIEVLMYNGEISDENEFFKCHIPAKDMPAAGTDWEEFSIKADTDEEQKKLGDLVLNFKVKVVDAAGGRTTTKDDLRMFHQDNETHDYSEHVIDEVGDEDDAVVQCWQSKTGASSKAVLWLPGRNDCFMHPHVAKTLFTERGYDFFVLNYSANGYTRKRNLVRSAHYDGHNRKGDCDLYLDQVEGAVGIIESSGYDEVVGYGHAYGATVLINYLNKYGDDAFSGFIFNSPLLDMTDGYLSRLIGGAAGALSNWIYGEDLDELHGVVPTPSVLEPIIYMGDEFVLNPNVCKVWLQYFFDFRSKPLYCCPLTTGYINSVKKVRDDLMELQGDSKFVTLKPVLNLTAKDETTASAEEMEIVSSEKTCVELRHNAFDVFLSEDPVDNDLAIDVVRDWMDSNGLGNLEEEARKKAEAAAVCKANAEAVVSLKEELEKAQEALKASEEARAKAERDAKASEAARENAQAEADAEKKARIEAEEREKALKDEVEDLKNDLDKALAEIAEKDQRIAQLEQQVKNKDATIKNTQAALNKAKGELAAINKAKNNFFLIVANNKVVKKFDNVNSAKSYLMSNYGRGAQNPSRMCCEVINGKVRDDPHKLSGGQNQGGGPSAGWNKFWWNWPDIKKMNGIAQTWVNSHK